MKNAVTLLLNLVLLLHALSRACSQALPLPAAEQRLESLAAGEESPMEDDSWLQQMERFKNSPLNLNTAAAEELRELAILTDLQIENFIAYRKLLGPLIDKYELQAVPSWDIITIKKLLPFITVAVTDNFYEGAKARLTAGDHSLLLRMAQVLEPSAGYLSTSPGSRYKGSRQQLFFRYRYQFKNVLQYGIAGDKDAGEQFFRGSQRQGFDFYSFHLFAKKIGAIHTLAIGDFTINMGQGLVHWQSLSFKKNADVINSKRQSPVLKPYSSAGEFNFHRGVGITLGKRTVQATVFVSWRNLSANLIADTTGPGNYFSSFITSGYHRTEGEIADRNSLQQFAYGGNLSWKKRRVSLGVNGIYHHFSFPLRKRDEPYNLFALGGKNWSNFSIDYGYTHRNFHLYGEGAIDHNYNRAVLNGLLISIDAKADLSIVHRSISRKYQSVNGNAFTENTAPSNERGFYAGISVRPVPALRFDGYADIYRFPWLKYLSDAPSSGSDFFVQLTYTPTRQVEIVTRYRTERKQTNHNDLSAATNFLIFIPKQNWRTQWNYAISKSLVIRNRFEWTLYDKKSEAGGTGFLCFLDLLFNPLTFPVSGSFRLSYFETTGYDTRLYAYENDMLYNYSIPVFFDKGWHYYLNINYNPGKRVSFWIKWGQTVYPGKQSRGSGTDETEGNTQSTFKCQALIRLESIRFKTS